MPARPGLEKDGNVKVRMKSGPGDKEPRGQRPGLHVWQNEVRTLCW